MSNAMAMGKGGLGSSIGGRHGSLLRTISAVCIAAGLLQACATKSETMAGIGVIAGAVIGNAIGGDKGALVGAAIGASIGYGIGKGMDEADRKKLAEARAMANQENAKQQFYSTSAKALVTVEPSKTYASPQKQALLFDKNTQVAPMTVVVTEAQAAYVDTPIYLSPDYNRAPKLLLAKGTSMQRIAAVDGTDWYGVGQGEYVIGYVHKDYFDQKIVAATERSRVGKANQVGPAC
jgi:surface antigen